VLLSFWTCPSSSISNRTQRFGIWVCFCLFVCLFIKSYKNIYILSFTRDTIYWILQYIVLIINDFISTFCGAENQGYYLLIMYIHVLNKPFSQTFRESARFYLYSLLFEVLSVWNLSSKHRRYNKRELYFYNVCCYFNFVSSWIYSPYALRN
jgi:hypothetical protein